MYLRWKRRPVAASRSYGGAPANDRWLAAVLVDTERADGRARQRFVKYLGTIRESFVALSAIADERVRRRAKDQKVRFWQRVSKTLAGMDLTPEDRERIEATIALRVPRFSAEEQAELDRERARVDARLRAMGIRS